MIYKGKNEPENNPFFVLCNSYTKHRQLIVLVVKTMARLQSMPQNVLIRDLPDKDKCALLFNGYETTLQRPLLLLRVHTLSLKLSIGLAS